MDKIEFEDIAELGNYMYELADEQSFVVSSVLFYEEAVELIRWLMAYDDIVVGSINIENEDYSGYDKEFYVTLDSDLFLDVAPAYINSGDNTNTGYTDIDADLILYIGDASSKIAIQSDCENKYEISIDEECGDCCYDCGACPHQETSRILSFMELLDYLL